MVASLAAKVPAPGSARHYAQIVKQNALMRRLDAAAKRIQQSVAERDGEPTEMVEQAERLLFQVAHEERTADFRELSEILHEEIDKLEALSNGNRRRDRDPVRLPGPRRRSPAASSRAT